MYVLYNCAEYNVGAAFWELYAYGVHGNWDSVITVRKVYFRGKNIESSCVKKILKYKLILFEFRFNIFGSNSV